MHGTGIYFAYPTPHTLISRGPGSGGLLHAGWQIRYERGRSADLGAARSWESAEGHVCELGQLISLTLPSNLLWLRERFSIHLCFKGCPILFFTAGPVHFIFFKSLLSGKFIWVNRMAKTLLGGRREFLRWKKNHRIYTEFTLPDSYKQGDNWKWLSAAI